MNFIYIDSTCEFDLESGGSYSLTYDIHSTIAISGITARQSILSHLGISLGASYYNPEDEDYDSSAYLYNIDTSKTADGGSIRTAVLKYRYFETSPNPVARPIRYGDSTAPGFEQVAYRDVNDQALLNSAGQPYSDPVMRSTYIKSFTISKYLAVNPSYLDQYVDTVNADPFLGRSSKTTKFCNWSVQGQNFHPVYGGYYDVSLDFQVSVQGWDLYVLDQGLMQLKDGKLQKILDSKGQPISEPLPLDGSGKLLPEGAPPVFRQHSMNNLVPWGGLGVS